MSQVGGQESWTVWPKAKGRSGLPACSAWRRACAGLRSDPEVATPARPTPAAAAISSNGAASAAATSERVTVGTPLAATDVAVAAGTGEARVTFSAPEVNAEIGASYRAVAFRAGTTSEVAAFDLATTGAQPWSQTLALPGGSYQLVIQSANAANGRGEDTAPTPAFTVGTPSAPVITQPAGSATGASFTFSAVPGAAKYNVSTYRNGARVASVEQAAAGVVSFSLDQLGEPDVYAFTVQVRSPPTLEGAQMPAQRGGAAGRVRSGRPAWGGPSLLPQGSAAQHTALQAEPPAQHPSAPAEPFSLLSPSWPQAVSASGELGQAARTPDLAVGLPGAPTITAVAAGLGESTVAWTAPAFNARIGATYSLQLLLASGVPAGSAVELAATQVGAGGTAFTATHAVLPPGEYKYQLLTENAFGDGAPSAPSAATRSREGGGRRGLGGGAGLGCSACHAGSHSP